MQAQIVKNIVTGLILLCITSALIACSARVEEVRRFPNAEKSLDAVVAVREVGATVATPTEVYVAQSGGRIEDAPVFRADDVDELEIVWTNPAELIISARKARVFLRSENAKVTLPNGQTRSVSIKMRIEHSLD